MTHRVRNVQYHPRANVTLLPRQEPISRREKLRIGE